MGSNKILTRIISLGVGITLGATQAVPFASAASLNRVLTSEAQNAFQVASKGGRFDIDMPKNPVFLRTPPGGAFRPTDVLNLSDYSPTELIPPGDYLLPLQVKVNENPYARSFGVFAVAWPIAVDATGLWTMVADNVYVRLLFSKDKKEEALLEVRITHQPSMVSLGEQSETLLASNGILIAQAEGLGVMNGQAAVPVTKTYIETAVRALQAIAVAAEETSVATITVGETVLQEAIIIESISGAAIAETGAAGAGTAIGGTVATATGIGILVFAVAGTGYYYREDISDFLDSWYDYFFPTYPVSSTEEERTASRQGRKLPQAFANLSEDTDRNRRRQNPCDLAKKIESRIRGTIRGTAAICYGVSRNNREDRSWAYEVWVATGDDYAPSKVSTSVERQAAYIPLGVSVVEIDAYRFSDKAAIDAKCYVEGRNLFKFAAERGIKLQRILDELERQARAVEASPEVEKLVWVMSTEGARQDFQNWFNGSRDAQEAVKDIVFEPVVMRPPAEGLLSQCLTKGGK